MPELVYPTNLEQWPLELVAHRFSAAFHGDYQRWQSAIDSLPELRNKNITIADTVSISGDVDNAILTEALQVLHPWRKGPFQIGEVCIDTEWRSDWKWDRIAPALGDLSGQRILDIGCGNGYFGWRMLDQGAEEVVGIDPTLLFCMQHRAISHYVGEHFGTTRNWVLPLKVEEVPATAQFDTTLSMGVIYHRRDPQQHVDEIFNLTKPNGRCVLESIVVETEESLYPDQRYARMRNVWCVPTVRQLIQWLEHAGFSTTALIDLTTTTKAEQRSTPWMHFESLQEALDPADPTRTVEGYPAPVRAVILAQRN